MAAVIKMIQNCLIGLVAFVIAWYWISSVERRPDEPRLDRGGLGRKRNL